MSDAELNAAPGGPGVSKQTPLGTGKSSSFESLGVDSRVVEGTNGSRPDMSFRYGGDRNDGELFVGNSAASSSAELNSGGGAKSSKGSGQYGAKGEEQGTVGSRESDPKYGRETNKGKLVGKGAGATKAANGKAITVGGVKTQPGQDVMAGSNDDRKSIARAKVGSGKTKS